MVDDRHLSREAIRAWIHKHLADAPERDDAWHRSVFRIYEAASPEAAAKHPTKS